MENTAIINSVVGEGTFCNGSIEAVDILRVDGSFTGNLHSRDVILVGTEGKIKGTLSAPRVIVAGMVDGTIEGSSLVILQSTSLILGHIKAAHVIIESNALVSASLESLTVDYKAQEEIDNDIQDMMVLEKPLVRVVEKFSSRTLARLFSE